MKPHYDYREEPTDDYCTTCGGKNTKNDDGSCGECVAVDEEENYFLDNNEKPSADSEKQVQTETL